MHLKWNYLCSGFVPRKQKQKIFKAILCNLLLCVVQSVSSLQIEMESCAPPDEPQRGGYGPRRSTYLPGDQIHYFCDPFTYIGGNYLRICEDNGRWTGNAPVCDSPATFSSVTQLFTEMPESENEALRATDGLQGTCTSTTSGETSTWTGVLDAPGEAIRVMMFLPKGEVAYEVFAVNNNKELSCGKKVGRIDRLRWEFHNCPGPNNRDITTIQIRSLSSRPLEICELIVHVLTDPHCWDPHHPIDNGHIQLSRKNAHLVCNPGFEKSQSTRLQCVRTGEWNKKALMCLEQESDDFEDNFDYK